MSTRFACKLKKDSKEFIVPAFVLNEGKPIEEIPEGYERAGSVKIMSMPLPFFNDIGRVYVHTEDMRQDLIVEVYASGSFLPYAFYVEARQDDELLKIKSKFYPTMYMGNRRVS